MYTVRTTRLSYYHVKKLIKLGYYFMVIFIFRDHSVSIIHLLLRRSIQSPSRQSLIFTDYLHVTYTRHLLKC